MRCHEYYKTVYQDGCAKDVTVSDIRKWKNRTIRQQQYDSKNSITSQTAKAMVTTPRITTTTRIGNRLKITYLK